jgi:hypothetical protein
MREPSEVSRRGRVRQGCGVEHAGEQREPCLGDRYSHKGPYPAPHYTCLPDRMPLPLRDSSTVPLG